MTTHKNEEAVALNSERASDAEKALGHYFGVKNTDVLPFDPDSEGRETLIDLLADLRHWARQNDVDFDAVAELSQTHFNSEKDEEGGDAQ